MFKVLGKKAGKCRFCGSESKAGVMVCFDDGSLPPGKYCWADLKKIVEMKSEPVEEREVVPTPLLDRIENGSRI